MAPGPKTRSQSTKVRGSWGATAIRKFPFHLRLVSSKQVTEMPRESNCRDGSERGAILTGCFGKSDWVVDRLLNEMPEFERKTK